MKVLKKLIIIPVLIAFISFGCSDLTNNPVESSSGENTTLQKGKPSESGNTIVDIAVADPDNFSILVAAVQAAGFDGLLSGNRQFTVFAPTNTAFEQLLSDLGLTAPELLANTELLKQVLSYHVSPGNKKAQKVLSSGRVNTLEGSFIFAGVVEGVPKVGNENNLYSDILAADIRASNGTIHVISAVLLPPTL
jgi:uncharacterized surface protein with fasciclin (FAS1) repeats